MPATRRGLPALSGRLENRPPQCPPDCVTARSGCVTVTVCSKVPFRFKGVTPHSRAFPPANRSPQRKPAVSACRSTLSKTTIFPFPRNSNPPPTGISPHFPFTRIFGAPYSSSVVAASLPPRSGLTHVWRSCPGGPGGAFAFLAAFDTGRFGRALIFSQPLPAR